MAISYITSRAGKAEPFFLYLPLTQLHYPTLPHRDFEGRTGKGDFADSLVELDARARDGELDAIVTAVHEIGRRLGVATPAIDALLGLARLFARQRGLYPLAS